MTKDNDLETRLASLEATVRDLQKMVLELRQAMAGQVATKPPLRSVGMLDRPKTGK